MINSIQAVRGMNDILPQESPYWQHVESVLRQITQQYGYQEIRMPVVEKTELFKRSIGEATDIVEKEMYTFLDRNNDSLTLCPEGTASCVRAGIEHGLLYNQIQRLWYMGPYFRHERPQKGRYRQFHQFGVEAFGMEGPDIDAEIILMTANILKKLGLLPHTTLQLNSLGSAAARAMYREHLVSYLTQHQEALDDDSKRRLSTNPLRILDSKNPAMQSLIENAPKLIDHLDAESKAHFAQLQSYLDAAKIDYVINPRLVRGLDYYTKTVFEWTTDALGAQGTVAAGGRYDTLVEQLGGKPTPALGFALGLERTILLLQQTQTTTLSQPADIYFITDNTLSFQKGLVMANTLRDQLPGISLVMNCGGGSFKNQFKKADKSGARIALILAENEIQSSTITIKFLRESAEQTTINQDELLRFLQEKLFVSTVVA